jgi:hypothetical protein
MDQYPAIKIGVDDMLARARSQRTTMSSYCRRIGICFIASIVIGSLSFAAAPANASQPVPRTIAGCVFNGGFISSDGYDIRPKHAGGGKVDLRTLEGRAVQLSGALLPGDLLILSETPRDLGPCKTMRPSQAGGDPIGELKKTSTFDRAQRVDVGTSRKGKPVCFFREEGSSHTLSIGIGAVGAFIRVASGDGPLAAESIPKPPLQVFAGMEITKLVDGDLKSTGEYMPIEIYEGATDYVPNLDTEYGGGFVVIGKGDAKSFFDMVASARKQFVVVQSTAEPKNVDVIAIYDFKASAIPPLLACAKKQIQ